MFSKSMKGLLLLSILGLALPVLAQTTTQGAIAGTVEDTTDAVIPKATVVVHNEATNAEQTVTADDSGYFKAPMLEPGSYTVAITVAGFGAYTAHNVVVQVGQLTSLEPHLTAGSAEQTVTVNADTPVLNYESPDATAVLTRKAIDDIPIQNRRWSALAMTTPGVVSDNSGFGLVSIRGISTLLNNVEIDGADDNQAYFSEERGRTREGYSTSANSVQEFAVNTGVYSAQYGRAAGGVINSVTRSGANEMHGEAYFTDLDRGFGAYVPGSLNYLGQPLKPKDLRKIYGGSVGGALKKDKLFWFYTFDQLKHSFPAVAQAASFGSASTVGSFLEQPDATVTSCGITPNSGGAVAVTGAAAHSALDQQVCAIAQRFNITYAQAVTDYNGAVNALVTQDLGTVPRFGDQEINTPKIDWQINGRNRVSFLYHRLRWDAPGDVQTGSTATYAIDAFGTDFVKLDYGLTKLETLITSNISNELLYQYGRELNDEGQYPYTQYTLNNLVAPGGSVAGLPANASGGTIPYIGLDTSIGFSLGSPYWSYRIAYPDERKWQIADTLSWTLGNHTLRMGGDFVHNYDLSNNAPYYYGDYTYSTISNYVSDLMNKGKTTPVCNYNGSGAAVGPSTFTSGSTTNVDSSGYYPCYSGEFQDYGASQYAIATLDSGAFVQDNWKVNTRLTLELGLRYDYESLPQPGTSLTSAIGSFVPYAGLTNAPKDKNNLGPRIGFSLDPFGGGRTVVRGGYGLYFGRIVNATLLSAYFGSGSPNGQYGIATIKPATAATASGTTTYTATAGESLFPYPIAGGSGTKPASYYLASNLQNPQVHEFDLAVQQQLGRGTVFQLYYMGALGRELPNFLDVNLATPTTTVTTTVVDTSGKGPLPNGTTFQIPTYTGYINPNFTNITEVISNINSSYNGLTAEILNRSFHNVQFDANYTWSHALDNNQNSTAGTTTNSWLFPQGTGRQNRGVSQWNVGNRFVGWVLYQLPQVSGGNPVKWLANGWSLNDTFQMQNGLPYSAGIKSGTGNSTVALNTGTWNGVPSVTYLPAVGLNTYQVPRVIVDDMRLQKSFLLADKYNLQLNADMYNVANHQNFTPTSSDISTTAYSFGSTTSSSSTLTYIPQTGPTTGFGAHEGSNNSGFLFTPREIQIGARLQF